jgi:hypothetical protein
MKVGTSMIQDQKQPDGTRDSHGRSVGFFVTPRRVAGIR